MAMPKKGSRSIIVDDVQYRWRLRGRATYSQWQGNSNLTVAVEPVADGEVSTLVVDTSATRPENFMGSDLPVSVTPAVIEAYIRLALKSGWKPNQKGKPFLLTADESMVTGKT